MSDLVDKLRNEDRVADVMTRKQLREAAAEIKRLRAELVQERARYDLLLSSITKMAKVQNDV